MSYTFSLTLFLTMLFRLQAARGHLSTERFAGTIPAVLSRFALLSVLRSSCKVIGTEDREGGQEVRM